jgi:hypothetical protein
MVALLPTPELQFIDADGHPYSGGTLATYVVGTTTPKPTWVDPNQSALNTNPIVLDSAGRCIVFGDGAYRCILRDSAGNLIYDQISDTIVSAAMQPVVSAPTIEDAKLLLGISGSVADEAAARAAADSAEQSARIAADNTLQTNINAEVTRAEAAEANLQAQITAIPAPTAVTKIQGGTAAAGSGHVRINFSPAFTSVISCVASIQGSAFTAVCIEVQADNAGADIYVSTTTNTPAVAPVYWMAIGT